MVNRIIQLQTNPRVASAQMAHKAQSSKWTCSLQPTRGHRGETPTAPRVTNAKQLAIKFIQACQERLLQTRMRSSNLSQSESNKVASRPLLMCSLERQAVSSKTWTRMRLITCLMCRVLYIWVAVTKAATRMASHLPIKLKMQTMMKCTTKIKIRRMLTSMMTWITILKMMMTWSMMILLTRMCSWKFKNRR